MKQNITINLPEEFIALCEEDGQVSLRSRDAKRDIPVNPFALDLRQPITSPAVPVTDTSPHLRFAGCRLRGQLPS